MRISDWSSDVCSSDLAMLFGHRKGAFTGATASSDGLFQAANGGTLFLDEIAELPLSLQAKLLRALQEGEVLPVGATHAVPVDVRVIAAGNRDLAALCNSGQRSEERRVGKEGVRTCISR